MFCNVSHSNIGRRSIVACTLAEVSNDGVSTDRIFDDEEAWAGASDKVLVHAAAIGEQDAFEAIVVRYGPQLLRYATTLLNDHGAAEEVVQDTLVAAWKSISDFRFQSSLRTWLFGITAHKVIDQQRRRTATPSEDWVLDRPAEASSVDPAARATNAGFMEDLGLALGELPYKQRACWLLREVEGMSHEEIGQVMALSNGAVRGNLQRARATLSVRMARWR
jgi:RNA polymerase sigma-70 factor, ECF subfamily